MEQDQNQRATKGTDSKQKKGRVLPHVAMEKRKQGFQAAEPTLCSMQSKWFGCASGGNGPQNTQKRMRGSLGPKQLGAAMQNMPRKKRI
jgi:hypothetical protein